MIQSSQLPTPDSRLPIPRSAVPFGTPILKLIITLKREFTIFIIF
ncbi:hypothetical protein [Moorena sp. SIO3E8]|nr:hypothetical protein [Moorena sp. SIO3E8]